MKFIALIACLLICIVAPAQEHGKTSMSVREEGGLMTVRFELGAFFVDTLQHCTSIHVDGMTTLNGNPGSPALPSLSRLVILPRGSRLVLRTLTLAGDEGHIALSDNCPLEAVPFPKPKSALPDNGQPHSIALPSARALGEDSALTCRRIGTMGDYEVYRLTANPMHLDATSEMIVYQSGFEATFEMMRGNVAPEFSLPPVFLVVAPEPFRNALQPFVQWKRHEGYDVKQLYVATNQRDSIKELMRPWFDQATPLAPAPRFVLLVGDAAQIQAYPGVTRPDGFSSHATDLYYVEFTGDYLPDAILGRWPVNDTAELNAVVAKTLAYEQCADLDPTHLRRVLLVAGAESSSVAPVTTNGQVNYLGREIAVAHPDLDTLCYRNPFSSGQRPQILHDMAIGASLVNYTAHCTVAGWSNPAVSFASLDTLDNPQPMLYVNNCCLSNDFTGTCFGEQLLRKPDGGAIGVIGATNSTLWNEDYFWAVGPKYPFSLTPAFDTAVPGAFDRWIGRMESVSTQGELLQAGNMAVTAYGSPYDKFYWEIYCLFGDPSLRPYYGTPQRLWVSAPDSLNPGTTDIRISGTPGALVTAMQGDRLLASVLLDDHRSSPMSFCTSADTLPIIFTATAPQAMPAYDTAYIFPAPHHSFGVRHVAASDSAIGFTLVNFGSDTLRNLTVLFEPNDTSGAAVAASPILLPLLLPRDTIRLSMPLSLESWNRYWEGYLIAFDSAAIDEPVRCRVIHWIDEMPPSLSFDLLTVDSTKVHNIRLSTTYMLHTTPEGQYDTVHLSVTALPHGAPVEGSIPQTPITTPGDSLTHLQINASIARGSYVADYEYYLVAGPRNDSFEEGFSSYPWNHNCLRPWVLDDTVSRSGHFSLRSAPITHRQTSDLSIEVFLPHVDSISFWVKTSCEERYDKLVFTVDGVRRQEFWGEADWYHCALPLAAGRHKLNWRYTKDDSDSRGSDCVWIDDVRLPFALWDQPYGWFGTADINAISAPDSDACHLSVYPNPASSHTFLSADIPLDIKVLDAFGRTVGTFSLSPSGPYKFATGHLPAGVYMIVASSGSSCHYEKLVVK